MSGFWHSEQLIALCDCLAGINAASRQAVAQERCRQAARALALLDKFVMPSSDFLLSEQEAAEQYRQVLCELSNEEPSLALIANTGNKTTTMLRMIAESAENLQPQKLIMLLELGIEITFGFPGTRLACYGSLRPGYRNHHVVESIQGDWISGTVPGFVWKFNGYPVFVFDISGPEIVVDVLQSRALPSHYSRLDEFEGEDYVRNLVVAKTQDGLPLVCNIYAFSQTAPESD